ncbi:hypothetical protein KKI24_23850 [bacterium]|nr:hypothetical protein [bacterium]
MNLWSKESIDFTRESFTKLKFFPRDDGFVYMKKKLSSEDKVIFGRLSVLHVLIQKWQVFDLKSNSETEYDSLEDMLNDGWVID